MPNSTASNVPQNRTQSRSQSVKFIIQCQEFLAQFFKKLEWPLLYTHAEVCGICKNCMSNTCPLLHRLCVCAIPAYVESLKFIHVYHPDSFPACDDLYDVCAEVYTLAAKWSDVSFALKLPLSLEETIKEIHGGDLTRCLRMVLSKWLQKCYKYDKHGPPSWRMLVKAVDDPFGGSNCALAETIAKKHLGMYMHAKHTLHI